MISDDQQLSPPLRLAIAYVSADLRAAFTVLLRFDERLAEVVGRASEPMIAQMKLAWWHDAIAREPSARPKGEPIFMALDKLASPSLDAAFNGLLDAWGRLLAVEVWTADILKAFACERSAAIFGSYADWTRCTDDVAAIGEAWALADLKQRFGARVVYDAPTQPPIVKARVLRPLSILALSVTKPSGIRMILHALTGR